MTTNATPAELLARLEAGFRANSAQLQTVENELSLTVQRGREFGEKHAIGPAFSSTWNSVEEILNRFRSLAAKIDQASRDNPDQQEIERGLDTWTTMETESTKLKTALDELPAHLAPLDSTARAEWNDLANTLEAELAELDDCIRIMRTRLDLQDGRSPEEINQFVQHVVKELQEHPLEEAGDDSTYQLEFLKSSIELAHEKHESLGFPRIIKTLFTWYENPEERVRRRLFLPID